MKDLLSRLDSDDLARVLITWGVFVVCIVVALCFTAFLITHVLVGRGLSC